MLNDKRYVRAGIFTMQRSNDKPFDVQSRTSNVIERDLVLRSALVLPLGFHGVCRLCQQLFDGLRFQVGKLCVGGWPWVAVAAHAPHTVPSRGYQTTTLVT